MECEIGIEVRKLGNWACSEIMNLSTNKSKRDICRIKASLAETLPLLSTGNLDIVCNSCLNTFAITRTAFCKHPDHKCKSVRLLRKLRFITALQFLNSDRNTRLLPNFGICSECPFDNLPDSSDSDSEQPPTKKQVLDKFNTVRKILSPNTEPITLGKRNLFGQRKAVATAVCSIEETLAEQFKGVGLDVGSSKDMSRIKKLEQDSQDLHWILDQVKSKMDNSSHSEKKSLLTLAPPSWSIPKISEFFGVSERLVKSSKKHKIEAGCILPPIQAKKGRKLDSEIKKAVVSFFYEDEVSRACAGQRQALSIKDPVTGKREMKQKRYLQDNLKELYAVFNGKPEYSGKIGFTSFTMLRPLECISHNTKNFHNVCLCIHHENPRWLLEAIGIHSTKPYLELFVCDTKSKNCHHRRCQNCIGNLAKVQKQILEDSSTLRERDIISYRQWLSTDGTHFVTVEKGKEEFIDFLGISLENLLKHHYTSHSQNSYLKELKANLTNEEIIIQMDFAENYSPTTQDAVQSEYFTHKQVTLHPCTLYWSEDGISKTKTYCFFSDCTLHDTNAVFAFQSVLIPKVQHKFREMGRQINQIHYFTDGCAAQYKNRKNFSNIFYHEKDFGLKVRWNFFATAHGKGPCDAAGGTTKRLLRTASLQGKTLLTVKDITGWCQENIKGMEYILVTASQIEEIVEKFDLDVRYNKASTIPGTQQCHSVRVDNENVLLFETSIDTEPMAVRKVAEKFKGITMEELSVNDRIGCIYDKNWYMAVINELDIESEEVGVTFWKPNPSIKTGTSYVSEGTSCFVPIGMVLKKLTPQKQSRRQKTFEISKDEQTELDLLLKKCLAQ